MSVKTESFVFIVAGNPGVEKKYPGLDWQLQVYTSLIVNCLHLIDCPPKPIPPASNPDSQRIFREHCQMAEEYLQVLKEIEDLELRKYVKDCRQSIDGTS